jgi:hypothetical protein
MPNLFHIIIFIKYNLFLLINPSKLDVVKVDYKGKQLVHRLTYHDIIRLYETGVKWRLNITDLFSFKDQYEIISDKEKP